MNMMGTQIIGKFQSFYLPELKFGAIAVRPQRWANRARQIILVLEVIELAITGERTDGERFAGVPLT